MALRDVNLTRLGQRLVLANLVLSVLFVAWAVGLATNQIPWNTPKGAPVPGLVEELTREITRLGAARDAADARTAVASTELQRLEAQRPVNQTFYANMLRSARQGDVASINPPVQQLQLQGSDVIAKASGRAVEINGQPALSRAGYEKAIQDTLQEIQKAQAEVTRLVAETQKLTVLVNGTKPRDQAVTAEEKGLRVLLAEQEELAKALRLEQQYILSPITYYTLQTEQLRQRQTALASRLAEIRSAAAALGVRP